MGTTKPFNGKIDIDVRHSVPDLTPYVQPRAPKDAPNIMFIVWDDVGFGAMSTFGGLIETPNMDRIAKLGLRYNQFHTTALCSPTRASMLTGRNHTTVGMACIAEGVTGFPGSNGHIPFETATIAEVLGELGWNTYMVGKWHCCPVDETNMASSKRNWPTGRGFERYYGFLGAETNQWYPDLVEDQHFVDQPYLPEQGYHLSKDLADKAISFIADAKQVAPEKPFFFYLSWGCSHAPHHAPKEWIEKYKGKFDMGYEQYRQIVFENQKRLGLLSEYAELSPLNPMAGAMSAEGQPWPNLDIVRPWDSLSADEKRLFCRMAEVYAGYVSYTDHQLGRVLDYLEQSGQLENTLIMTLSDNGASGEGGPNGSVNENKFVNNILDPIEDNLPLIDELGGPNTYNHYPNGWAVAFCTPFKLYKRYAWNGGICDPFIISWPRVIKDGGGIRNQYIHVSDLVPTVYECLGIEPPSEVKGYTQWALEGTSFQYSFKDAQAKTRKQTQYYTMLGSRGIYHEGWKANTVHPTMADWSHFIEDKWELFNLADDPTECHDLSAKYPEKLEQLKSLWFVEAGKYFGLPIDDRTPLEIMMDVMAQIGESHDRYVYYPHTSEVPESVTANIRGRSYKIAAEVELDSNASGVIFAHGSKFGGHSLYIKDGRLKYCYNYVGMKEQIITASQPLPTGICVLGVEFVKEKMETIGGSPLPNATIGSAKLFINDQQVGALSPFQTQVGSFAICGEGVCIGRDGGSNVTNDYSGNSPWAFSNGTIKQVIVDVSDEPYVNLEREAIAMMKRD